jgi:NADPH:quinone reductase-like Zn-dependent oxidoreductase
MCIFFCHFLCLFFSVDVMKKTMMAALIHNFEGIEKVSLEEVPIPFPQEDEVQIAISYAGINPVDWKIAEGLLKTRMQYELPIILGWDAAGTISKIGKEVKNLNVGDPVFAYCRKEIIRDGSFAEYICLPAENVVKKPKNLSFAEAAAFPLCALTAWQSLYDTARVKARERILIHAGAGGVGGMAIQLAKLAGAHVITTSSEANSDYVKKLGADEVIDYTKEYFVNVLQKNYPKGMDVVYDTVGGDTLKASYQVAKGGGRLVTIAGIVDQALASKHHLIADFVFVRPDGKELSQIASLIEEKKLFAPNIHEVPFEEIALALRKSREGHAQGKLVLKIT